MRNLQVSILSTISPHAGWGPVNHLVNLACSCFSAKATDVKGGRFPKLQKLRPRLESTPTADTILLCFVENPGQTSKIVSDPSFHQRAALRIIWIIDSFWTEMLSSRALRDFDLVIHMQNYDASIYNTAGNGSSLFLPWGSDVLSLGSDRLDREYDLLRVGRQPMEWDDDLKTLQNLASEGLRFHGRPPTTITYPELMSYYSASRFIVAHSNLAAPAPYTHPNKDYFTGRWTDAIGSGAGVLGIPPVSDIGLYDMLWEEALLEIDSLDLQASFAVLTEAVHAWTPRIAQVNYLNSLSRLDWRWRFKELAEFIGLESTSLEYEIAALRHKISNYDIV